MILLLLGGAGWDLTVVVHLAYQAGSGYLLPGTFHILSYLTKKKLIKIKNQLQTISEWQNRQIK